MLSYRHGFHAGNHADVLKHLIQLRSLRHLLQKDKAVWYVDTHAGAGRYALTDSTALKNAEFETGIGRLWGARKLPEPLADLVDEVRRFQQVDLPAGKTDDGRLRRYPGSPQIAAQVLRSQDRIRCFEKHGTEIRVLAQNLAGLGRQAQAEAGDGFERLSSVLPPPSRRGLVLIDPSYEDKRDYRHVRQAMLGAMERFPTGTYLIWYPLVRRRDAMLLPGAMRLLAGADWLHATLTVKAEPEDGYGLFGSGVFVVNPPWTLTAELTASLPVLTELLGQDAEAAWLLETPTQTAGTPNRFTARARPVQGTSAMRAPGGGATPPGRRSPVRRPTPAGSPGRRSSTGTRS
jgi:23S rRNA (adenine2030-N6)-methyltransferase